MLTDSPLTKTQWKKAAPHLDSCVCAAVPDCRGAEEMCGCLDLHIGHQDALAPPAHSQRWKHQRILSIHCTNLRTSLTLEGHLQCLCWITTRKVLSLVSGWNRWLRVPGSLHLCLTAIKNAVYCRPSQFLPLFGCVYRILWKDHTVTVLQKLFTGSWHIYCMWRWHSSSLLNHTF